MSLAAAEPLPIAEASRRGVSKLVADAENGHATILRRHAEPVAAVISFHELQRLQGLERDLVDVALVLARAATDSGRRTSLDEAIESLGFTRDQLASMDDPA
ncbi:type II toxin-antitoxin system Phd/YefM family antitoxin [Sporichthya polymorpha]|uniref:type II toxin-antitoxin system Phd/YefM family antitoxin n=1 Tax=Sporichthya polymorpha TaxID=35751 RepID=UPI00037E2BF9|nr:type II toxin-antitoxin system Phd/YefM family antitoxin [Sporichthya polymorpha]